MNQFQSNLDKISLYGMAPIHSQKGKSRKKLRQELSMRLHPKKHARRPTPGASTRNGQRPTSPGYVESKGPMAEYSDRRLTLIRDSQGVRERVVILRKAQTDEPGLNSPDNPCGRSSRYGEDSIGVRDI